MELRILDAQKKVREALNNKDLSEEDSAKQSDEAVKELDHLRTQKAETLKAEGDEVREAQSAKADNFDAELRERIE